MRICFDRIRNGNGVCYTERDTFESNRESKGQGKCDVHESGVGVLDVTKGERLIGMVENDETKWWCGHTVDGSKTGIFPVSAVSEEHGNGCSFEVHGSKHSKGS